MALSVKELENGALVINFNLWYGKQIEVVSSGMIQVEDIPHKPEIEYKYGFEYYEDEN